MTKRLDLKLDTYKYGFHDPERYVYKSKKGLDAGVVKEISHQKEESEWMRKFRLNALKIFESKAMPTWGADLSGVNFWDIYYYLRPTEKTERTWSDVPKRIRETYERLGIPEAERGFLAGVKAQYDSEVIYGSLLENLKKRGVIFLSMDEGLKQYPELVKQYFGRVVPPTDNKFAALNSAVWSGGSFIRIPEGFTVELPLQAYFRINAANMGQFERTLIIAEPGSYVTYIEGCTSPIYTTDSLHAAVVEIVVKKGARVRYTTVQNWSDNVYNLVTKRMLVHEEGVGEWVDCNIGCLAADTNIFTNLRGPIPISQLQKGDWIYTLDLNSLTSVKQEVVAVKPTGKKRLYHVITENYREIKATSNHPFLTLNRRKHSGVFTVTWKPLGELKQHDYIATANQLPDEGKSREIKYVYPFVKGGRLQTKVVLPKESSDELMWLLGLYLGDGFVEKSKSGRPRRVYFAVPERDRARRRLVSTLKNLFKVDWRPKGICVTIGSSLLADLILSLGFGGTAKEKCVPSWVWSLPLSQELSFIEGYLDADGYIRNNKVIDGIQYGRITMASANKDLLEQLKLLMISCGLNPLKVTTYIKARKLYKGGEKTYCSHYLCLNLRDNLEIIRTKKPTKEIIQFVRIKSIKPLGEKIVYDLETEHNHNFVANGIVVHNSKITMKYPSLYLVGRKARGEVLSMAYGGKNQHQDVGGKAIHNASETASRITSKSISTNGGRTSYRGLLQVSPQASNCKAKVVCDALILDEESRSDTYPTINIDNNEVTVEHEASVSKIGEEKLFYLMSRGLSEEEASAMIVNGFIESIVKELPLEYTVEMNRLIQLEMEGSVG